MLQNTLARRCTSWCHQLRFRVQTMGINKRGIICLLIGVLSRVRVPCWEVRQELVFCSSFCGCSSSILKQPDHENPRRKSSFATAILLQRWRMRAHLKAHDPLHRSACWSAVDLPANNVANMVASLAPSNLRRDSKAPGRAKQGPSFRLTW